MKKIQTSTVKMTADVQVLNINSYLISKVVKTYIRTSDAVQQAKHNKQKWNEETNKWENELDENGNTIIEYHEINGQLIAEEVLPLLEELTNAFEE